MTTTRAGDLAVDEVQALAGILDRAALERRACARRSDVAPLPVDVAYEVQRALVARRLERGARPLGVKLVSVTAAVSGLGRVRFDVGEERTEET